MSADAMVVESQAPLSELEQKIAALVERHRASRYEDIEALLELTELLPDSDGVPLETPWHSAAIALLKQVLAYHWRERTDFFVGGNMFVYYNIERLLNQDFRGPDFFYVSNVDRQRLREKWVVWIEGKFPNLIIELLSPSTAEVDRTTKKELYEKTFQTPEYFCYDPDGQLEGWRLGERGYEAIQADERGWMWSGQLGMWLGRWSGEFQGIDATWLRFYDAQGQLIPLAEEAERTRADAERTRADAERTRADAAEQEVARLRAMLAELEKKQREQAPSAAALPEQGGGQPGSE
jgi:Uma2 family endonuclease